MSAEYRTVVERQGRMYRQLWKITDEGNRILLSDEPIPHAWEESPDSYFPVTCRICGQTWAFPMVYRKSFTEHEGRGWECSHCKRRFGFR